MSFQEGKEEFFFHLSIFSLGMISELHCSLNLSTSSILQGEDFSQESDSTSLSLLKCFYHLFSLCTCCWSQHTSQLHSVQVSNSSYMEMCFVGGWEAGKFWRGEYLSCFVATLSFLLQLPSLSWVGLGPCADVGLIPRRVGSFCRIFTLKKYNTVCLLYLGNFSSIPFCCRIFWQELEVFWSSDRATDLVQLALH